MIVVRRTLTPGDTDVDRVCPVRVHVTKVFVRLTTTLTIWLTPQCGDTIIHYKNSTTRGMIQVLKISNTIFGRYTRWRKKCFGPFCWQLTWYWNIFMELSNTGLWIINNILQDRFRLCPEGVQFSSWKIFTMLDKNIICKVHYCSTLLKYSSAHCPKLCAF